MNAYGETDRCRMGKEIDKAIGSEGFEVLTAVVPGIQTLFSFQNDAEKKQTDNNESVTASADGLTASSLQWNPFSDLYAPSHIPLFYFLMTYSGLIKLHSRFFVPSPPIRSCDIFFSSVLIVMKSMRQATRLLLC